MVFICSPVLNHVVFSEEGIASSDLSSVQSLSHFAVNLQAEN